MRAKEAPEAEIIKILKAGSGYISGQALSDTLGISRTAVWKHIKGLRKAGFIIEASPSKGYRIDVSPGKVPFNGIEILSELKTGIIGRKIFFYPDIDSTNTKAFELGRLGVPEGTAVIADAQSAGKGRIGRRWESPPGCNVYTSVVLRPRIPPQFAHNLTFLVAVAVAETVRCFLGQGVTVKWPNDILAGSRKIAGILLEMDSEADTTHFVVAGIGVNVNITRSMFPESLKAVATSISDKKGEEVDRAHFTRVLYSSIEKWYKVYSENGFMPVMKEWKGYFEGEGKPVKVNTFNRAISGICTGIDESGALLVRTGSGQIERVLSGDIVMTGKW